ncbi:hypothetical protein C8R44DRAFT_860183 [Mycena epipterygia]|nr:hypothetical protein C8R44DRAFT_860183 [Mycena epipterygia]
MSGINTGKGYSGIYLKRYVRALNVGPAFKWRVRRRAKSYTLRDFGWRPRVRRASRGRSAGDTNVGDTKRWRLERLKCQVLESAKYLGWAALTAQRLGEVGSPTTNPKIPVDVFLALQMVGLVGSCALVLTTTLSSRAPRNATWQNFFTSWIISTASYSLLLLSGQANKQHPTFGVCLAQAGLIYGIPSLTAATTFGLIAPIWFNVQALLSRKVKNERVWTIGFLIFPYVVFFAMFTASWVVGTRHPELVVMIESGMYCHIVCAGHLDIDGKGLGGAGCFNANSDVGPRKYVMICMALRGNWTAFKRMEHSMSITLRIILFTMFGILAIALSAIFVFTETRASVGLNIVFATRRHFSLDVLDEANGGEDALYPGFFSR